MVLPKDFFSSKMLFIPNQKKYLKWIYAVWLDEIPLVETVYSFPMYVYEHCTENI